MQLTFMRKIRLLAYSGDRLKQANVYLQNWLAIEEALLCGVGAGGGWVLLSPIPVTLKTDIPQLISKSQGPHRGS